MRRRLTGSVAILVIAAASFAMAACTPPIVADVSRDTEARIQAFLANVRAQTNGSGWEELRAHVREAYPGGRAAWIQAVASSDTSGLTWTIGEITVDDYVGCARVEFGGDRAAVPLTLYDDQLPAPARVATSLSSGPFVICAKVGPLPWDAGVQGIG